MSDEIISEPLAAAEAESAQPVEKADTENTTGEPGRRKPEASFGEMLFAV